jgi:hypothetical protein
MNRDPTVVGRAKVGAELIAEVINGFVEPISWKTLVGPIVTLIPGTERNGQFVFSPSRPLRCPHWLS